MDDPYSGGNRYCEIEQKWRINQKRISHMNKVGFHFKKISNFELLLPIEILAKKKSDLVYPGIA